MTFIKALVVELKKAQGSCECRGSWHFPRASQCDGGARRGQGFHPCFAGVHQCLRGHTGTGRGAQGSLSAALHPEALSMHGTLFVRKESFACKRVCPSVCLSVALLNSWPTPGF